MLHGRFGKHFGIDVKQSGIFPPKHLEANGHVHMISCKKGDAIWQEAIYLPSLL